MEEIIPDDYLSPFFFFFYDKIIYIPRENSILYKLKIVNIQAKGGYNY